MTKLVLDFDPKTKMELVTVAGTMFTDMMDHQIKGVTSMWDACFESTNKLKEDPGSGCVLAHSFGSGKTRQVVALVHTVLTNPACKVLSRSFLLFFLLLDINSRVLLIVFFLTG